ncbi:WcaI family glycosyltransferase [Sinorhizobium sp. BG8]|uniref:WcaI family glycosyltransferase n=1 Tax=Sinorhizobium sp. BG8 TaxID=2613773 RepID=UPI00193C9609|nr:WcaI family glycosyltransferase [Sinorhizobium sp. BG8]QRM56457.1 WcaI family glycosyltransferase [Sinorhizobium sp. BG8]
MNIRSDAFPVGGEHLTAASRPRKRKTVLVHAMNYAPEKTGAGRYTGDIAGHFAAMGMAVTVVTTPPHYPAWEVDRGYGNRYASRIEDGITVVRVPLILRPGARLWRLLAPASFAASAAPVVLWQILRKRPDVVFCVEPTLLGAPFALLAAKLVGARTVLHVHDLEIDAAFAMGHLGKHRWLMRVGEFFETAVRKRFDIVVTISRRMAEKLLEKGVAADRVAVVRNWVDLSAIFPLPGASPYRDELGYADEDFVVLYSGNLGAKQGLDLLIEAARTLQGVQGIRFVIGGDGPAKAELERLGSVLGNVRFLPLQPAHRFNEFLNMADLHLLPQRRGAADLLLPSKLGALLASGKPVVVTADPETELATFVGDAALVIPPEDPAALVSTILKVRSGALRTRPDHGKELCRTLARGDGLAAMLSIVDR